MDMPQETAPAPSAQPSFGAAPAMQVQMQPAVITNLATAPAPPLSTEPMTSLAPAAPAPIADNPGGPEIISPLVIGGAPIENNAVVIGFAKQVPLPVALRQILPSGYAFSIDQDVDMGTLVSFQGGRPWRETLRDALAPVGLVMRDQGQMVMVGHSRMAPSVVTALPAPIPMAVGPAYREGMAPRNLAVANMAPVPMQVSPSVIVPIPDDAIKLEAIKDPNVNDVWMAERGAHLRHVLEDWCRRANVEFNWLSEYDYPLQASVSFSGNFETAVRSLLAGFEDAHPEPVAELHSNANVGQMVLVVRSRGNTNNN